MVKTIICNTKNEIMDSFIIRHDVFVIEQKISLNDEFDLIEKERVVFLTYYNDIPVATARFYIKNQIGKIERVAVLKEYRNLHIGKSLIDYIEEYCLINGAIEINLGAQITAVCFYEKLNYQKHGDSYLDANIVHYHMKKSLI